MMILVKMIIKILEEGTKITKKWEEQKDIKTTEDNNKMSMIWMEILEDHHKMSKIWMKIIECLNCKIMLDIEMIDNPKGNFI